MTILLPIAFVVFLILIFFCILSIAKEQSDHEDAMYVKEISLVDKRAREALGRKDGRNDNCG